MNANDWFEASKGFADEQFCVALANDFVNRGEDAANNLSLSVVGPVLKVAEEEGEDDVEILLGMKWLD